METPRRWVQDVPPLLAILAFVQPLARLTARWDWRMDLLSHFQEPALILTLLAVAALLRSRRRSAAVLLLILAAIQAEPMIRLNLPNPVRPGSPSGPRLRILLSNVLVNNGEYPALARLIRETRPDVVGLVEVSEEWVEGLADVARDYPYRLDAPNGPLGLSLWFKEPPIAIDPPEQAGPGGWPYLHATFPFAGEVRQLWLVHPSSPLRRLGECPGFPELESLGRRIAGVRGSKIVVGDMNTTDGSPHFRDFLAETGLRDSRLGFGRQASWPVASFYRIAIDHAFVSSDLAVTSRELGPPIGSDHRPLLLELAPAAPMASSASAAQASASSR